MFSPSHFYSTTTENALTGMATGNGPPQAPRDIQTTRGCVFVGTHPLGSGIRKCIILPEVAGVTLSSGMRQN